MTKQFISRFTPSSMPAETLEAIFVEREPLAQRVLDLIRESITTGAKQQTLLVGQRGLGKTHFVSLVYHRLKKQADLQGKFQVAWLREEEWGVASFLDLLVRILQALAQQYKDETLSEQIDQLFDLPVDQAEAAAGNWLKQWLGARVLVLIIENLDVIFDGLGDLGQKRFRSYLQENNFCTILATTQGLFNGVSLQKSPFYGFFRIQHLQGLDVDGVGNLLRKLALLEGKEDLEQFIHSRIGKDRINAVHHLAGGCHRIYIIFYQFLTRQSLEELVTPFMELLDELTPYYQARMSYLSPQQRKIIEVLCNQRGAMPVKEIARRCFITPQTTSSQLKDLQEKGYVRSTSAGREAFYEMKEPLMRLCLEVKQVRGEPIRLFIDFLKIWYSADELRDRLHALPEPSIERGYILQALEENPQEPANSESISEAYWLKIQGDEFYEKGRYAEGIVLLEKALDLFHKFSDEESPAFTATLNNLALLHYSQGKYIEAEPLYERALAIKEKVLGAEHPDVGTTLNNLALLYHRQGKYAKAETLYLRDLAISEKVLGPEHPDVATTLNNLAGLHESQGKYAEAEPLYERALGIREKVLGPEHPDVANTLNNLAALYESQGKYAEAEPLYERAFAIQEKVLGPEHPDVATTLNNLAGLHESQGKYAEAEPLFIQALVISRKSFGEEHPDVADTLINLGLLCLKQRDWRQAYLNYQQALAIAQNPEIQSSVLPILQRKFKGCFQELAKSGVDARELEDWVGLWRSVAEGRDEFQVIFRLLETLWKYRKTSGDIRVLLELPAEERAILEEAMAE